MVLAIDKIFSADGAPLIYRRSAIPVSVLGEDVAEEAALRPLDRGRLSGAVADPSGPRDAH